MSRDLARENPRRTSPRPSDAFTTCWLRKQRLPEQFAREQQQAGAVPGERPEDAENEQTGPHDTQQN